MTRSGCDSRALYAARSEPPGVVRLGEPLRVVIVVPEGMANGGGGRAEASVPGGAEEGTDR